MKPHRAPKTDKGRKRTARITAFPARARSHKKVRPTDPTTFDADVSGFGEAVEILPSKVKRSVANAWTPELVKKGFVGLSRTFLREYAKLSPPITHGEAMFIVHLMDFKWDSQAPFPGYKTIAGYMGVTVKQARRLAKSLDDKKYLRREIRESTTNRFFLEPLFEALKKRLS